jgi:methyl-accepting chemotaxis protein
MKASAWPLRRQIAAGIGFSLLILVILGIASFAGAQSLVSMNERLDRSRRVIIELEQTLSHLREAEAAQRAFLITSQEDLLLPYAEASREIDLDYSDLRRLTADDPEQLRRLEQLRPLLRERLGELGGAIDQHRREGFESAAKSLGEGRGRRAMEAIQLAIHALNDAELGRLGQLEAEVVSTERRVFATLLGGTLGAALITIAVGGVVIRGMNRTIGVAVQRMQSSAAELHAAATQQARGAKEQATASQEVSATIQELLSTSRQIAERARRVTEVANHAASAARTGDAAVEKADEAIVATQKQVERIVGHMLALGRKSQEIGAILDIINDLAEETNILAINATVEAAGAGEAGRRFSVVADEIRKLSDRTGMSAREIRALIEEIRTAANTTVMATESGSKAAQAGAAGFREVAVNFRKIVELVGSTAEVAREIELSTKQQTTAVEQVNAAIAEVAETAQQTESSSTQALSTASEISALSLELGALIQEPARA